MASAEVGITQFFLKAKLQPFPLCVSSLLCCQLSSKNSCWPFAFPFTSRDAPEGAEEATLLAALASEDADAIDETVEEDVLSEVESESAEDAIAEDVSQETEVEPAAEENGENA